MLFYFLAVLSLASALPTAPRASFFQSRVIGGENAHSGQFPWQASLQRFGSHFCGGSLISTRYVATAAHCEYTSGVKVGIGGHIYSNTEFLIDQQFFTAHPQWNSRKIDFDYAVITLATPVSTSSNNVGTIELAASGYEVIPGSMGTISGWGYISGPGSAIIPSNLQWTHINMVSQSDCQSVWGRGIDITHQMQCVGGLGTVSSCMGDSGGPLVADVNGKTVLIGIASWAESNCNTAYPVGYAKVSAVRAWFDTVTQ